MSPSVILFTAVGIAILVISALCYLLQETLYAHSTKRVLQYFSPMVLTQKENLNRSDFYAFLKYNCL